MFYEYWLLYKLLIWLGETVSDDFTAISGKKPVTFGKLKYLTIFLAAMKRKNEAVFFEGGVGLWLQLFSFHREKILCFRFTGSLLHFSPAFLQFCKDTPKTHCIIPWKEVRGSCFWVLTAIPVVPWLGETVLSDDFQTANLGRLVWNPSLRSF